MSTKSKETYRPVIPDPVPVKLSVDKTALVIIDMQNDFCKPKGTMYGGKMTDASIRPIGRLLDRARKQGVKVVHTQAWYSANDPRFSDHPKAAYPNRGCKAGTWGVRFIDELQPMEGETVIKKSGYDPWFGTDLEKALNSMGFGSFRHDSVHKNRRRNECSVIITGTASDCCVEEGVAGFYYRGYGIIIPADCVSTSRKFSQDAALYKFSKQYFAVITRSDLIEFQDEK